MKKRFGLRRSFKHLSAIATFEWVVSKLTWLWGHKVWLSVSASTIGGLYGALLRVPSWSLILLLIGTPAVLLLLLASFLSLAERVARVRERSRQKSFPNVTLSEYRFLEYYADDTGLYIVWPEARIANNDVERANLLLCLSISSIGGNIGLQLEPIYSSQIEEIAKPRELLSDMVSLEGRSAISGIMAWHLPPELCEMLGWDKTLLSEEMRHYPCRIIVKDYHSTLRRECEESVIVGKFR